MNSVERTKVAQTIITIAHYYGRDFEKEVIAMMVEDLADLPATDVLRAYSEYRKEPKNRAFPLPAQIRDMIVPKKEIDGKEIATRINAAVVKFGWAGPLEAERYIGEIGWNVVDSFGGWSYICENLGVNLNPTVFYSQVREVATDRLRIKAADDLKAINAPKRAELPSSPLPDNVTQILQEKEAEPPKISEEERQELLQTFLKNIKGV